MILFSLVAYWILSYFKPFNIELEGIFGSSDAVSFLYLAGVYFAYLVWATGVSYSLLRKIKFRPIYYSETAKKPMLGHTNFAGLEIEIPKNWEITDCYVTIEKAILIYGANHVLLDQKKSLWFADITKPIYKRLRWKSPYASQEGKLIIGDNSEKETFFICGINIGTSRIKSGSRKKEIPMRNFEFSLLSTPSTVLKFESFGLYEVSILFHWSSRGRKMPTKSFDGYLYSNIRPNILTGNKPVLIIGEGDYRKDKKIPKPLLEDVKHETKEQPKAQEKKSTKNRTKKGSSH